MPITEDKGKIKMRTKQEILDKLKKDEEYLKNVKFKPADIPIYITILKEISVLKWVLGEE
ncbi:MAG: hypothetical protein QW203_07825 [Thermoplasmatales archaeon]